MSKLLVQTKSFLPMVIQKSTSETIHLLDSPPILSIKLDLPPKTQNSVNKFEKCQENNEENPIKLQIENKQDASNITIRIFPEHTLTQALMKDVMQVQVWLAEMLARGHMRLFRQDQGLLRTLGQEHSSTMVWLDGRPQLKEEEPNPILPEQSKKMPIKREHQKAHERSPVKKDEDKPKPFPPFKSNLVEAVLERTPEWQKSISSNLGALQKKVVERLPK